VARKSIVDQFRGSTYKDKYTVEKEDDIGQIQLASGGFGDIGDLDEAALKQIMEQHQKKYRYSFV
jgi:hypothetical protein